MNSIQYANPCSCKRDGDKQHCPHCGRANYYAIKQTITRPHPLTGIMTDNISIFRCKTCGKNFDELQWRYQCKADPPRILAIAKKKEDYANILMTKAERGDKFSENDKRHFKKYVGYTYDDYMVTIVIPQRQSHQNVAPEAPKQTSNEQILNKLNTTTPYEWHVMHCTNCQMDDEDCEVGKQLKIAESLPQPFASNK